MTPSEILQKHEDANEMHLHHVDRKWVFEAMEEYANICNQRLKTLAKLLAKTWFYGEWEWENPNERIQQMIMQDLGYYPFKDEDEMIHKTRVDEELYREAVDKVPLGNPRTPTPVECHNSSDIGDKEKSEFPIISDEEIEKAFTIGSGFQKTVYSDRIEGAKWYREQLKQRQ
jgi:hypothetical protein